MKKSFVFFALILSVAPVFSQLKTTTLCPPLVVDILDGTVNTLLSPTSTVSQVKEKFPCFTSVQESSTACGAGVFYKDRDIYFYVGRNYVEIREKFKGKLSIPLMGAARNGLFKWLGIPKIKDVSWDAFQTAYGTLILYYSKTSRVNKIQFSTKSTESIQLCE